MKLGKNYINYLNPTVFSQGVRAYGRKHTVTLDEVILFHEISAYGVRDRISLDRILFCVGLTRKKGRPNLRTVLDGP